LRTAAIGGAIGASALSRSAGIGKDAVKSAVGAVANADQRAEDVE